MTHMTKDLDGICDMKDSLMRKVRGKMDDREGRDEDEDDDEEWIEHDDMPNRNRTSSGRFRRRNTVGRRYPGRAAQPPQDGRRDHVEGRHSRATQAHQGESHQVVDHVDRLMRR